MREFTYSSREGGRNKEIKIQHNNTEFLNSATHS
jgi:hypothetical protein